MESALDALHRELEKRETTHHRRKQIGEQLDKMGDPRPGVGVRGELPDFAWLPVAPGGEVEIRRVWEPESPTDKPRITHIQHFHVKPFYIAKYLVTYKQFQAFVDAKDGYENPTWWRAIPDPFQHQELDRQQPMQFNKPRGGISWYQCIAFARWVNHRFQEFELPHPCGNGFLRVGENAQIRLPLEWEWQWAAQNGSEARGYPWGEKNTDSANTVEAGLQQAIAVGMYPHGAAACGALDMTGNLMEWCANDKSLEAIDVKSKAPKTLRGGDWGYSIDIASCTRADDETPERNDLLNGCRMVLGEVIPTL